MFTSQSHSPRERVAGPWLLIPVVLTRMETVQNAVGPWGGEETEVSLWPGPGSDAGPHPQGVGSRAAVLLSWGQKDLLTRISENLGS